jgi:glucoamylase
MFRSATSLLLAGSIALQSVFAHPGAYAINEREATVLKRSVDSFIATESPIALSRILCNIGSDGACVPGAKTGVVIAGPGKANPDCKCFFTWMKLVRHFD